MFNTQPTEHIQQTLGRVLRRNHVHVQSGLLQGFGRFAADRSDLWQCPLQRFFTHLSQKIFGRIFAAEHDPMVRVQSRKRPITDFRFLRRACGNSREKQRLAAPLFNRPNKPFGLFGTARNHNGFILQRSHRENPLTMTQRPPAKVFVPNDGPIL